MESSQTVATTVMKVNIVRGNPDAGDESVVMLFKKLDAKVMLSDSSVEDIKNLFDAAFEFIALNKTLIEFEIEDIENDLFNHITRDIIEQLNAEIKESAVNFSKIWQLMD